ncbi:hypothetical protein [Parachlamydia sp. AcF125]|nr:hypothetical protein [Parachlamydia sp. AcF125]
MEPDIQQIRTLAIVARKAGRIEQVKKLLEIVALASLLGAVLHSF